MTIQYTTEKDARGRKTGVIVARFEGGGASCYLQGRGPTKADASSALFGIAARAWAETNHAYIFTHDGTILVVQFNGQQWGYDIVKRDDARSYCCSCWGTDADTYAHTIVRATAHAEQSYGGVLTIKTS